ncbi:MAG: hypothetical protein M1825_006382 [Sarcosagium campestre]|nr:MAG: hypothetical protein M1825_006382 [Sarcosagium campestre]
MKRNPRKLKWTKSFRQAAGKEMTVDATLLAFTNAGARRNIPVRYNRDTVAASLRAMERVQEVRARRERVFYKQRMKGNREKQRMADLKVVAEGGHLLQGLGSSKIEAQGMVVEGRKVPGQRQKNKTALRERLLVDGGVEVEGGADDDDGGMDLD